MKCRVLESGMCIITQGYKKGVHDGVDLVNTNSKGDHILGWEVAHSDGVVVATRNNCQGFEKGSYGNYVKLRHSNGYYTLYAHIAYNTVKVKVGDKVKRGQVLGYMGNTGYSFGGHLHWEVRTPSDVKIDPTPYLDKDLPSQDEFQKGYDYVTLDDMYVRWGAGTNYGIKLVKNLTPDGKKNAYYQNPDAYAIYKKGSIYTALDVIRNEYGIWARTPSGYVCMEGISGTKYARRK